MPQRTPFKNSLPLRLLLVLAAFLLMIISSGVFVNNMLRGYLKRDAEKTLAQTQIRIMSELREPATLMISVAKEVRDIIMEGGDVGGVRKYYDEISAELRTKPIGFIFDGFHGYFEALGNRYIPVTGWTAPAYYDPTQRPWYKAAIEANGEIVPSPAHISPRSGEYQVTFASRIFDDENNPLGIVLMNVPLRNITDFVAGTRLTKSGYGFLINEHFEIIAHPESDFITKHMDDVDSGLREILGILKQRRDVSGLETENYQGVNSVFFCRQIENGWYLGIVVPRKEYYGDLHDMMALISALGAVLAGVLIIMLICLERAKRRADEANHEKSMRLAAMEKAAEADKQLKEALAAAQSANRAKSTFLAIMSHEIRTPMNSIMGFAELAQSKTSEPHICDYLCKISDSAKWLLRIINDILDISKIESGRMELENTVFDLREIVSLCQSAISSSVKKKGLDLRVYAELPEGKKLVGDPVRLYQTLMNLLSNAVKFTKSGTVKFSSTVKSSAGSRAVIYFEVKDSGIGMSPQQVEKIFDPFIQADSSTTRKYGGTGLGLTITKNLVELMGGKLLVESVLGAGSAFSFEIEFETVDAPDSASESAKINTIEKPRFNGLVLVCDDNLMNQQVICEHLSGMGLDAVVAENGEEGVERVIERVQNGEAAFDLIFMDIFMPVMDGMEAASKITALNTGTPIIAVTANVMSGEFEKYKESGMADCLGKPFTSQELRRVLLKYLTPVSSERIDERKYRTEQDELLAKLRINFVKSNRNKYAEIMEAVDAGDISLGYRLVHTLKGNAGQIGETALQSAAAAVEAQLKDAAAALPVRAATCRPLVSEESVNRLKNELSSVIAGLAPLLDVGESSAQVRPLLDSIQIKELLEKLEKMLENINPECVNMLGEIRSIDGADELGRHIESYDFESAARTLAELKKRWE